MSYKLTRTEGAKFEQGFSMLELMLVLVVAGTISAFAVIRIQSSREALTLQNSVRQLASQIEKARLDAVRRHASSQVVFDSNTSYNVTMDFDGNGTAVPRNYRLPSGIEIPPGSPLPSISFNWRGRTSACTNTFAFQSYSGLQSWVDVSDAGDVTINSDADILPSVSFATVSTTGGIAPTTVVPGTGTHSNVLDCDTTTSGTAGPPVTGNGSGGCTLTVNPSFLSIRKSGGSSGSIVVGANTSGTVNASGPVNLRILPASQSIAANGSATFSVTSLNSTRSTFAVNFSSPCTTVTTLVKVTN
ncbi:MAG: type II secretion system protein [Acidobacteriota bacterium]